jgi:hypothetical protein
LVERRLCKPEVVGSNPTNSTTPPQVGGLFFDMLARCKRKGKPSNARSACKLACKRARD